MAMRTPTFEEARPADYLIRLAFAEAAGGDGRVAETSLVILTATAD
jgi:hypothetical protein